MTCENSTLSFVVNNYWHLISASGIRFYRLTKLRDTFLRWKTLWKRKGELMRFEDAVQSKGNKARKQRIFIHWKHCILAKSSGKSDNNDSMSKEHQPQTTTTQQ
jgi:hypothetical protein